MLRRLTVLAAALAGLVCGQGPASRPVGVIIAVDTEARRLTMKTDAGPELLVALPETVNVLRVPPGEKDLSHATKMPLAGLAAGDRVLVRGKLAGDGKTVEAATVIVMTKSDLAQKQAAERADWDRRGIAGVITALNPGSREITVSVRGLGAPPKSVIVNAEKAVLRRYAPDSVRFADARPCAFEELRVGDQVRARGEKSPDGGRLIAEELVSGSFRNLAATVKSVDEPHQTILITDLDSKKPVLVRVNPDSNLRTMPPMMAQFIAYRLHGGEGPAAGPRPVAAGTARGGPGAGGPPDMQHMLERMPALALRDLKPGDALIIAGTVGAKADEITAITLLAGVEPILTKPSDRQMMLSNWNLDMNMNLP